MAKSRKVAASEEWQFQASVEVANISTKRTSGRSPKVVSQKNLEFAIVSDFAIRISKLTIILVFLGLGAMLFFARLRLSPGLPLTRSLFRAAIV
jgi:hypothetical protein